MPQFLEGKGHSRISWVKSGYQSEQYIRIEWKTTVLQVDRFDKILFDEQNRIIGNTVISVLITKAAITTHCIKSFEKIWTSDFKFMWPQVLWGNIEENFGNGHNCTWDVQTEKSEFPRSNQTWRSVFRHCSGIVRLFSLVVQSAVQAPCLHFMASLLFKVWTRETNSFEKCQEGEHNSFVLEVFNSWR